MSVALGAGSLQVPGELGVGWVAAQPRGAGLWRLDARSSSTIFHTLLRQRGVLHEGFFSPRGTALVRNSSQSLVPKLSTGVAAQQGQELPVDGSGGAVW